MAAHANPLFDIAPIIEPQAEAPAPTLSALSRLTRIHAEAIETARLANLLGRSLYAALAMAVLSAVTLAVAEGGAGASQSFVWAVLMAAGVVAMLRAYTYAIRQPFERATLQAFAQDIHACQLYAGFAWGAGAFLALPATASTGAALSFAAVPAIVLIALLRERQAVFLFLAPAAILTSLACVLRPFGGGLLSASVVLAACGAVGVVAHVVARANAGRYGAALPHALTAS